MTSLAKVTLTGKIITGPELWKLAPEEVVRRGYECRFCGLKLLPTSFKQDENLIRPYFRKEQGASHADDCSGSFEGRLKSRARTESVWRMGFPLPYPSKLVLDDNVEEHDSSSLVRESRRHDEELVDTPTDRKRHNFSVENIRPLAQHYVDYPHDRHLRLTVPGVEGDTYSEVFEPLYNGPIEIYSCPKIFYAPLYFNQPTVEQEDVAFVKLRAGESDGIAVRLEMREWSQRVRNYTLREIAVAREEHKQANKDGNRSIGAWLFFIGVQSKRQPRLFRVTDSRLICCLTADLIRPKQKVETRSNQIGYSLTNAGGISPTSPKEAPTHSSSFEHPPTRDRGVGNRPLDFSSNHRGESKEHAEPAQAPESNDNHTFAQNRITKTKDTRKRARGEWLRRLIDYLVEKL